MKRVVHPLSLFKVRLYKSRHVPGMWVACYCMDLQTPAADGCRQTPIKYLRPAYGNTPGLAYHNLTRSQA